MARAPKNAAAQADDTAVDYIVKTPIEHDGENYEVGDTITLNSTHSRPLLETNPPAIKAAGKAKADEDAGEETPE